MAGEADCGDSIVQLSTIIMEEDEVHTTGKPFIKKSIYVNLRFSTAEHNVESVSEWPVLCWY